MVEIDKQSETKIKHDGIFDFKEVYRYLYTLLVDEQYDLEERVYTEKATQKGKEIEIAWIAKRKISDYFRFQIKVNWLILGMTDVEVTKDGQKLKMNKGSLELKFSCYLEKDYEHRWEGSAFFKFLRGLYDNYIVRSRISEYELKVMAEMDDIIEQIKAFLVFESKK